MKKQKITGIKAVHRVEAEGWAITMTTSMRGNADKVPG